MKLRKKFDASIQGEKAIMAITENNPAALNAVMDMMHGYGAAQTIALMPALADMNIRGEQLAYAYQEYCGRDVGTFVAAIEARDENMVKAINKFAESAHIKHRAVTEGALKADKLPTFDNE